MMDEDINGLLEQLNQKNFEDVVIAQIGKCVWWGFVYDSVETCLKSADMTPEKGCEFFFIKSGNGKFAAAVFRMGCDELHWFVAKRYRRKGILVNPLKKIILPFIFAYHEQDSQQASVKLDSPSAKYSAKLARKVGFRMIKILEQKGIYQTDKASVRKYNPTMRKATNQTEIESLNKQAKLNLRSLRMIVDTYQVRYGSLSHRSQTGIAHSLIGSLGCDLWMPQVGSKDR